ncbi:MAG: HAMP domain-containing histidine kinase [Anaerolineae bacterium]|nr:HAMP domain-containing histidine kinase [Anaerolineae bacterium]
MKQAASSTFHTLRHSIGIRRFYLMLILVSVVIYTAFLALNYAAVRQTPIMAISLLPVMFAAWLLGQRAGLITAVLISGLHLIISLGNQSDAQDVFVLHINFVGSLLLFMISLLVGWLSGINRSLKQELTKRQQAEAELQRLNNELERRVAERTAALTEANHQLVELDHLKSKFVADISHELRTPLTGLRMSLYLLERDKDSERGRHIGNLNRQLDRLVELVENILSFSRIEANTLDVSFIPVDLNTLMTKAITSLQVQAEAAGLRVTFDPGLHLSHVSANPPYLMQVITNLLGNAIKYTPAGTVHIKTYLSDATPPQVCLSIRDTGMGIAPDDIPHIFERFYRGKKVGSSNIPGTGIGLSIVKEIMDLHGGTIRVESQLRAGSTFELRFPVRSATHGLTASFGASAAPAPESTLTSVEKTA